MYKSCSASSEIQVSVWVCVSKFHRNVYTLFLFLPLSLRNHPGLALFHLLSLPYERRIPLFLSFGITWEKGIPLIWVRVKTAIWLGHFSLLSLHRPLKWHIFPKQDVVVRLPQLWVAEVPVIWVSQTLPWVFLYHSMILKLDSRPTASSRMFH